MKIQTTKYFEKMYDKLQKKEQICVQDALAVFGEDPFYRTLNNHLLKGKYAGLRSINAKGDLRIIFREESDGRYELVSLENVGSHSQLYG